MRYNTELPNSLNERIFEKIKKKYLLDIRPSVNPQGIILGGQPGSGKSFLQKEIAKEFTEDFIFISTDDLRLFHPVYLELQQNPETVQNAANLVNPYASAWTEKLIKYCIENKYNLIIDSTLGGNIQAVYDTIDMFRNNDYQVHLRVMAVPAIISKLSIFLRYETQLAEKGFARWTRMEDHDDRFENLKINLIAILNTKPPDSIKFYERVLEALGTNKLKYLNNFQVKDLENIEVNSKMLSFVENMADRIETLIQKRNGSLKEFATSFL